MFLELNILIDSNIVGHVEPGALIYLGMFSFIDYKRVVFSFKARRR